MDHFEATIKELEEKLHWNLEQAKVIDIVLRNLRDIQKHRTPTQTQEIPQQSKSKKTKTRSVVNSSSKESRKGSRKPFSQYKGVTKGYIRKDGAIIFKANIWKDGINQCLGHFDIEEEAAAHAAKARGEIERANELFEIAKRKAAAIKPLADTLQVQDRPKGSRGAKVSPAKKTVWKCNHCGTQTTSDKPPYQCIGCNGAAFTEVTK